MPNTQVFRRSFAAGEVSPLMFGRIDSVQFQTGLRRCRNMVVRPEGVVQRRSGFEYVGATDGNGEVALLPFVFNEDESFVVAIGDNWIRFYRNGEALTYTPVTYLASIAFTVGMTTTYGGADYVCIKTTGGNIDPTNTTYWAQLTHGVYEIPSPYAAADLAEINYAQRADVITLVHPSYGVRTLRRYADTQWELRTESFAPALTTPSAPTVTPNYGEQMSVAEFQLNTTYQGEVVVLTDGPMDLYALGDTLQFKNMRWLGIDDVGKLWRIHAKVGSTGKQVRVQDVSTGTALCPGQTAANAVSADSWKLTDFNSTTNTVTWTQALTTNARVWFDISAGNGINTGQWYYVVNLTNGGLTFQLSLTASPSHSAINLTGTPSPSGYRINRVDPRGELYPSTQAFDLESVYKLAAVDADDNESLASAQTSVENNLLAANGYNTISYAGVTPTGTAKFRVYKKQSGLFGYIGEFNVGEEFIDDNIAPDMSRNPIEVDSDFNAGGDYPGAVCYFEQRKMFAGSGDYPQMVWATNPGEETAMVYHLPSLDSDRLKFEIASTQFSRVRHLVPLESVLALTSSSEYRISSTSGPLTAESLLVRPQGYLGASYVRPQIVGSSIVFCAERGGHVREVGYDDRRAGYVSSDLSLRATHLFDGLSIRSSALQQSPYPVLWFVSSDGSLLSLTYIPEERIGAWAKHTMEGWAFESVAVIPEGEEDRLYATAYATGTSNRVVLRMGALTTQPLTLDRSVEMTAGRGAEILTLSDGRSWAAGDIIRLDGTTGFTGAVVGDRVILEFDDGTECGVTLTNTPGASHAYGRLESALYPALDGVPLPNWRWARITVSGLGHLEGEEVTYQADGATTGTATVSSGSITMSVAAEYAQVGVLYTSQIQTLPLAVEVAGYAQGAARNINKVSIRADATATMQAGPTEADLVSVTETGEEPEVVVQPSWADGGVILQTNTPGTMTVVAMNLEASIGGL